MTTQKTSWQILSLAFIGLAIVALAGIAMLAVLVDELAESGWAVPNIMRALLTHSQAVRANTGNEFTGDATAALFAASVVPVGVDLISRTIIRYAPFGARVKGFIRRINNTQRKYLLPLHTYLSILALGLGILHLSLSNCAGNPFPELGLILAGVLTATGLLFKLKALPGALRKSLYKFHASLIVSGVLVAILFTGHVIMELD
jgi:hypothetical protein